MNEWYIIDTRTGRIVNCVTTTRSTDEVLSRFEDREHLTAKRGQEIPLATLQAYEWWGKRP